MSPDPSDTHDDTHDDAHSDGDARMDDSARPKDFKLELAKQRLTIEWFDGQRGCVELAQLRKHCPCATCRTERSAEQDNPLRILKSDPAGVRVVNARLVGHYAIQFDWSDGHNTGIFQFELLRSLASPI